MGTVTVFGASCQIQIQGGCLMLRVLHVSMQHDYGDRNRPESYEYVNFYDSFLRAGYQVRFFDYMEETKRLGKEGMNRELLRVAEEFAPNVAVVSLYTDQFVPETFQALRKITKTLCFFHDDMWRRDFSRFWAPHFDYFSSSDFESERKYKKQGLNHIIHFPFGVNQHVYKPENSEKKYDVSFVGQWHPYREWLINRIRKAGFSVKVVGYRWPGGPVTQEEMVQIFNQSKINLNLSNSTSWDARFLASSPKALYTRLRSKKDVEQLKARHFEINACRAFQLSYYVDGLERCYRIGEEIGVFISPDDLLEKLAYYLSDSELITEIAEAGYQRTLRDHTYTQRFAGVFNTMGVPGLVPTEQ